jgi:serine/threonine protein kinase
MQAPGQSAMSGTGSAVQAPEIPDHELLCLIGRGAYGEVWMARNAVGTLRAVKIVRRPSFERAEHFEREFKGLLKFEPISRSHDGLVDILQIGRRDDAGYFYYVMELANACPSL